MIKCKNANVKLKADEGVFTLLEDYTWITKALLNCIQQDGIPKEDALRFINEAITVASFDSDEELGKYMTQKILKKHKELLERFEMLFEEREVEENE